jgi:hypothetical protein
MLEGIGELQGIIPGYPEGGLKGIAKDPGFAGIPRLENPGNRLLGKPV